MAWTDYMGVRKLETGRFQLFEYDTEAIYGSVYLRSKKDGSEFATFTFDISHPSFFPGDLMDIATVVQEIENGNIKFDEKGYSVK